MRVAAASLGVVLFLASCSESVEEPQAVETTQQVVTSTSALQASSTSSTTAPTTSTTAAVEEELFRIAPEGDWPGKVFVYSRAGLRSASPDGGIQELDSEAVSVAVNAFEHGVVYQRYDDEQRAFLNVDGKDEAILVGQENQRIRIVGARESSAGVELLYTRRTESDPVETEETLRSLNMDTGKVTEVLEVGGWESGTDFNYVSNSLAAGRWTGEAFTRLHIIDIEAGEIITRFPDRDEDCFDGEQDESGCGWFDWIAAVSNEKAYGFELITGFAEMTLFEVDLDTAELTELVSFPWENGRFYPSDIWLANGKVVVSLSTEPDSYSYDQGLSPLPALIYDLETGQVTTAPEAGHLIPG